MRNELLILCFTAVMIGISFFTLPNPEFPSAEFLGFSPDSYSYYSTAQTLVGRNQTSFYKLHRPLYPILSAPIVLVFDSPLSMLAVPILSALLAPILLFHITKDILEERFALLSALFLPVSNLFLMHSTAALTEVPALAAGLLAVLIWRSKNRPLFKCAAFAFALLMRDSNLMFLLSAAASDLLHKKDTKWLKLMSLTFLFFAPMYLYYYYDGWVLYPAQGNIIYTSLFQRVGAFVVTLFNAAGELLMFSAIWLYGFTRKRKKTELEHFFIFNIIWASLMQISWSIIYTRLWLNAIPAFIVLSVLALSKQGFVPTLIVWGYMLFFSLPYSMLAKILKDLF